MLKSNRRSCLKAALAPMLLGAEGSPLRGAQGPPSSPTFIATWKQGLPAVNRAAEVLNGGGSLLDAVEKGINVAELDPEVTSVGYGGLPNEDGVVELDAAIMDGARHRSGAVCSLHNIRTPISVARQVLEKTRHTTLAGQGAFQFALKTGFQPQPLHTATSLTRWEQWKANPGRKSFWLSEENHDTIGLVGIDGRGNTVSGCSTSGLKWKIAGRVGDSPLVGCGVFADNHAGAASATGDGDLMTNYCTSVRIVDFMRGGLAPQEACMEMLRFMNRVDSRTRRGAIAVIAINPRGEVGAACMNPAFALKVAVWKKGRSEMRDAAILHRG